MTASVGIAMSGRAHSNAEDVLRDADIAMYHAKSLRRGSFAVFDVAMHAGMVTRLGLQAELRTAMDREQFEMHYQPIVDFDNERHRPLRGARALASSRARSRAPHRLPAGHGGDRSDGQARALDRRRGVPPDRALAADLRRRRERERQRVTSPVLGHQPAAAHPRLPPSPSAHAGQPDARDHRRRDRAQSGRGPRASSRSSTRPGSTSRSTTSARACRRSTRCTASRSTG